MPCCCTRPLTSLSQVHVDATKLVSMWTPGVWQHLLQPFRASQLHVQFVPLCISSRYRIVVQSNGTRCDSLDVRVSGQVSSTYSAVIRQHGWGIPEAFAMAAAAASYYNAGWSEQHCNHCETNACNNGYRGPHALPGYADPLVT